jgi:hypothetical protein
MLNDSDHHRITYEGWSYRTNGSGWTIYRDPQTHNWQTRAEAICLIRGRAEAAPSGVNSPGASAPCIDRRQPTNDEEMVPTQTAPKRQEGEGNSLLERIA